MRLKQFVWWLTGWLPLPEIIEWPLSEWSDPSAMHNRREFKNYVKPERTR